MLRIMAVVSVVLISAGAAEARDWRLFHRSPGPGTSWSYYGLGNGGPAIADPPCPGKGCGVTPPVANRAIVPVRSPGVPVYVPHPGMLNTSDLYRGYPYPGLGWFGPLTPSPRPRPTTVNTYAQ